VLLSELITGLMACTTRAERKVCCGITDLEASKSRTIVMRIFAPSHWSAETGQFLVSLGVGASLIEDTVHTSPALCISLSLVHGYPLEYPGCSLKNSRREAQRCCSSCTHSWPMYVVSATRMCSTFCISDRPPDYRLVSQSQLGPSTRIYYSNLAKLLLSGRLSIKIASKIETSAQKPESAYFAHFPTEFSAARPGAHWLGAGARDGKTRPEP
jgi:hypothetical protein